MAWSTLAVLLLAQQPDFEPLYRQTLEQREQSLGKNATKTVESARDLALYLAGRGEYARSAAYVEQALTAADATEAATALHNWALAIEERDAALAERLYRKALEIRGNKLPVADIELASTRLNLAALVLARDAGEAGRLASSALAAFDRKNPMDARSGAACGIQGAALATKGDVAGAERMFRRALAVSEKANGPASAQTVNALENLADLLTQTGRESAARPLLDRAQKIRAGAR